MAQGQKLICANKKAFHDYHVEESVEAGIALLGTEVKSLRAGRATLKDSYAEPVGDQLFLVGVHIAPYEAASYNNHDPERRRKLLLHKNQIRRLSGRVTEKGLTLIPLKMYFSRGRAKVEIALARGKRLYDKREDLKKKEAEREVERAFKERRRE